MADVTLTEAEQEALLAAFLEPDDDCAHNVVPIFAAVERILAERIREAVDEAKAEALRSDWLDDLRRRERAVAWDECVAAATGGGLTPLAGMLREDNPYRGGGRTVSGRG